MNSYHPKIKLTIETNPKKFLDIMITINNGRVHTNIYRKCTKLPTHWSSRVPKRYKRNAITGDLHRSKRISSNLKEEVSLIRSKYQNAGYPKRFTESTINQFLVPKENESFLIPPSLFEEKKPFLLLELPFCELNEKVSKTFLKKFHSFTNNKYDMAIKWITRKVKNLFPLKGKNKHPACKIYKGVCSCGEEYIGETKRNVSIRWREHEKLNGTCEPLKHLQHYPEHSFTWSILSMASIHDRTRKNLEASFIALLRPSLNDQLNSNVLNLFRNGVT